MNAAQLNALSIDELIVLNKKIVAIVKEKQRMNNRTASFDFMAGDAVTYKSSFGGQVNAKVLQVKRTKVLVEVGQGGRYLVPASMLKKV